MKRKNVLNSLKPIFALMQKNGVGFLKGIFRTNMSDTEITKNLKNTEDYTPFDIVFSDGIKYLCELNLPGYSKKTTVSHKSLSDFDGNFGGLTLNLPLNDEVKESDIVYIMIELKFDIPSGGEFMAYIKMNDFWSAKRTGIM